MSADGREFLGTIAARCSARSPAAIPVRCRRDSDDGARRLVEDGSIWFRSVNEEAGLLQLTADGTVPSGSERSTSASRRCASCPADGRRSSCARRSGYLPVRHSSWISRPARRLVDRSGRGRSSLYVRISGLRHRRRHALRLGLRFIHRSRERRAGDHCDRRRHRRQQHRAVRRRRNGTVVYIPEEPRSLVLIGRDGSIRPATAEKNFHAPMFSPMAAGSRSTSTRPMDGTSGCSTSRMDC